MAEEYLPIPVRKSLTVLRDGGPMTLSDFVNGSLGKLELNGDTHRYFVERLNEVLAAGLASESKTETTINYNISAIGRTALQNDDTLRNSDPSAYLQYCVEGAKAASSEAESATNSVFHILLNGKPAGTA